MRTLFHFPLSPFSRCARLALDALGERAAARRTRTLTDAGWCAADMWLFSAAVWLDGLPARKGTAANIDQLLSLGWVLPAPIRTWADAFRAHDDMNVAKKG